MRANMSWVMTDCPHREKLGWLECAYLLQPSFLYRYEGREWFGKIARDIRDAQEPTRPRLDRGAQLPGGQLPRRVQLDAWSGARRRCWCRGSTIVWFGDRQILSDNFDMMRRFTDFIGKEAKDGIAPAGLGDWYDYGHGKPPGPSRFTPTELSATATWGLCAEAVSRAAEALGRAEDAKTYRELHARIAADFQRHFQDPATRQAAPKGSPQCANAMALCAGLVPPADRAAAGRGHHRRPGEARLAANARGRWPCLFHPRAGRGRALGCSAPRLFAHGPGQLWRHSGQGADLAAGNLGRDDGRLPIAQPLHVGPRDGMVLRLRRRHPAGDQQRRLAGNPHCPESRSP